MAIPSSRWFPTTLQDRAAWYDNFNTNIQIIGASLGLTAPELASINDDNQVMQFLATAAVTIDAYQDGIRAYRKTVTEGDIGAPKPDFPNDISFSPPVTVGTGIFERLDNYVKRIRVAPDYSPDDGALLGIVPSPGGSGFNPESSKPVLEATPMPGNIVDVKFVRGSSDGIAVQTSIDKADLAPAGNYFKSPVALSIPTNVDNLPRLVQIRARYLVGNTPVGDYSDIVTVQTIP